MHVLPPDTGCRGALAIEAPVHENQRKKKKGKGKKEDEGEAAGDWGAMNVRISR